MSRARSKAYHNIIFIFFIKGNISHGHLTHPACINAGSYCFRRKEIGKSAGNRTSCALIYKTSPVADIGSGCWCGIGGKNRN